MFMYCFFSLAAVEADGLLRGFIVLYDEPKLSSTKTSQEGITGKLCTKAR